jgi:hypothetical protein
LIDGGQQNRLGRRTNTGDDRWRWCAFAQDVMGGWAGKCNNQPPLSTSIRLVIETMGSRGMRGGGDVTINWVKGGHGRREEGGGRQQLLWAEAAQSHRRLITQQSTPKARALDSEVSNENTTQNNNQMRRGELELQICLQLLCTLKSDIVMNI